MLQIAICDDEKNVLDDIRKMISRFFTKKNMEIHIHSFSCGEELLRCSKAMDIVFLDIRMQAMDGMKAARKLREQGYNGFLIFITVLSEMVFQSFEVQAYDYLVKPIREEDFQKTMNRLLTSMKSCNRDNLLVQRGNETFLIAFDRIIFCEVINRKIYLHLTSGEVMDYYDKIETLQERLGKIFFRCHRSYLINLKHLKSYTNQNACMDNNAAIPISRLRRSEFSDVILQYMKERK